MQYYMQMAFMQVSSDNIRTKVEGWCGIATGSDEMEVLQVKAGAERARRKRLKTSAVVGVTCCSAVLPVLDEQQFDVVFLDECSQMVEPLSLLPLARARCR